MVLAAKFASLIELQQATYTTCHNIQILTGAEVNTEKLCPEVM